VNLATRTNLVPNLRSSTLQGQANHVNPGLFLVNAGADCPLDEALKLEHKSLQLLCASDDKREGIRAFLEKRPPVYTGR
jgi:enoyl-CoA hydratase/carnithine racemase